MMRKIIGFTVLVFTAVTSLIAQQNTNPEIAVRGQLVDSLTYETIPYATLSVALASSPNSIITRLVCDDDGVFKVSLRASGSYSFTIQSLGKNTIVRTFDIPANQSSVELGKIFMSDLDRHLGEITVIAQKPLVKMDIDKITYNLEDDPESRTNSTLEMLRKVPMITVDGEDKIQLKGSDNFKIYLNGKPANMLSGSNASSVLKGMPASSVKNIEVITDPGARYDAEGIGGIINIITSRNSLQGYTATVNAEATSLGGYRGGGYLTTKVDKLGLTASYNYNYNNRPWTNYESVREQYGSFANTLEQKGRNRNSGSFQFGSFEASYELDTMNLIRLSSDLYGGKSKSKQDIHAQMTPLSETGIPYSYDLNSVSQNNYLSTEFNMDFQHSTKKKDELLTFSYRFANSPDDSRNETYLNNVVNYYNYGMYPRISNNDARTGEHTGQIDYTTPTLKNQALEAGLKYIIRQSKSDIDEKILDEESNKWEPYIRPTDRFSHVQNIISGYLSYSLKHKNFSYKAGIRSENTSLKAKYENDSGMNFSTSYFDIVPNATVSYMFNMASQVRFGYNMRIYRPGIWYLNPYINNTDPQNISYGNPNLSSEKSHGFNINYSMFSPKINFNANISYRFVNNSIEQYTFVNKETGVNETTYENIGKNQGVNLFLYGRWSPVKFFSIGANLGLNYNKIESTARGLSNEGFSGMSNANANFTLPKDFNIVAEFLYFIPSVQLQTKTSPYTVHGLSINKSFMNRKLTVGLVAQSPLVKNIRFKSTMEDEAFRSTTVSYYPIQEVRLRVSYRFGTLKGNIRQLSRGILNDDTKSGGSNNSVGGSTVAQ